MIGDWRIYKEINARDVSKAVRLLLDDRVSYALEVPDNEGRLVIYYVISGKRAPSNSEGEDNLRLVDDLSKDDGWKATGILGVASKNATRRTLRQLIPWAFVLFAINLGLGALLLLLIQSLV